MSDDYYTAQTHKLLAAFDGVRISVRPILAQRYGADTANGILSEAKDRFEALIPHLPYVGGDSSQATSWLVFAARGLAIYQAMKARGCTAEDTGELIYLVAEAQNAKAPPIQPQEREQRFRQLMERSLSTIAQTQARPFAAGWAGTLVESDDREFDFGFDWTECGICKYLHAYEADDLAPYMCLTDFVQSRANGWGLQRTMTLAEGHTKCDFRFKLGRETQQAWPPRFLGKHASV